MQAEKAIYLISELNARFNTIRKEIETLTNLEKDHVGKYFNQLQKKNKELGEIKKTTCEIYVFDAKDREVFVPLQNRLYNEIKQEETLLNLGLEETECESG